jgi:hypothetical protein
MLQCFVQGHATTRKRTSNYVGCCLLDEKFRLRLVEQFASQNIDCATVLNHVKVACSWIVT